MILVGSFVDFSNRTCLSYLRVWIDLFYDVIFWSTIIKFYTKQKHYSTCTPLICLDTTRCMIGWLDNQRLVQYSQSHNYLILNQGSTCWADYVTKWRMHLHSVLFWTMTISKEPVVDMFVNFGPHKDGFVTCLT